MLLGLAKAPKESTPIESLSEKELVERALLERQERANAETMRLKTTDKSTPWLFITTNAGSTGLNLQAANTVINVDLPWNPALLEQRIGRAHRMGQERPVQVYILVTEDTLEERLLATLTSKRELSLAVLDPDSEVDEIDMVSGMEELRRRLEVLLGAEAAAPKDQSKQDEVRDEAEAQAQQARVAAAGGQMLTAAFTFLGEMLPKQETTSSAAATAIRETLEKATQVDEEGRPQLTITLPDKEALARFADTMARLIPPS